MGGFGGYKWASEPTVLCLISIVLTVVHSVGGMSFQVQIGSVGCYNVRGAPSFLFLDSSGASQIANAAVVQGAVYNLHTGSINIYIYIYIFISK